METPRDPYASSPPEGRKKREGLWLLLLLLVVGGIIAWSIMGGDDDPDRTAGTAGMDTTNVTTDADRMAGAATDTLTVEERALANRGPDGRCIAGLSKTNVLDVLKQYNFRIDTLGDDRFRAVRKTFGADYEVTVVSDGVACVHDLNAWVKADGVLKNAQATQDFFQLFADMPLKGAHPDSTFAWMNEHSTLPEASVAYGRTRFTMAAPDRNTRVLRVLSSDVEVAHK